MSLQSYIDRFLCMDETVALLSVNSNLPLSYIYNSFAAMQYIATIVTCKYMTIRGRMQMQFFHTFQIILHTCVLNRNDTDSKGVNKQISYLCRIIKGTHGKGDFSDSRGNSSEKKIKVTNPFVTVSCIKSDNNYDM